MPIILLLGPSGVGKSTIAQELATSKNMLHIEADQFPNDGISLANLREEWDAFYNNHQPARLCKELMNRAAIGSHCGAVLSLPSLVVLPLSLIKESLDVGLSTIVLYGSTVDCIRTFLQREITSGRNLNIDHWHCNNDHSYYAHSQNDYDKYRINVFQNGSHRPTGNIISDILTS